MIIPLWFLKLLVGGKKLTGWGKNGPAYFFPGERMGRPILSTGKNWLGGNSGLLHRYFPVNATGMANMLICRHFANLDLSAYIVYITEQLYLWTSGYYHHSIIMSAVQINFAGEEELRELPGVGARVAKNIVRFRENFPITPANIHDIHKLKTPKRLLQLIDFTDQPVHAKGRSRPIYQPQEYFV